MNKILSATIQLLAVAALAMPAYGETMAVATGVESGFYYNSGLSFAKAYERKAKLGKGSVEVLETAGCLENSDLFEDGEVDVAFLQRDCLLMHPISRDYSEHVIGKERIIFLSNKESGYDDLGDLDGDEKAVLALVADSGAEVTLSAFATVDKGYIWQYANAIRFPILSQAAAAAAAGVYGDKKIAGLLLVGQSLPEDLIKAFKGKLWVGDSEDGSFDELKVGNVKLYSECEIETKELKGMDHFGYGNPDTVCVDAVAIYASKDRKQMREMVSALLTIN